MGKCSRLEGGVKAYCDDYGLCGGFENRGMGINRKYSSDKTMCVGKPYYGIPPEYKIPSDPSKHSFKKI